MPHDAIVQGIKDGMVVLDSSERMTQMNPAAQRILGCSEAEAMGRSIASLIPGWGDATLNAAMQEDGWETTMEVEAEERHYRLSVTPLQGREKAAHLLTMRDNTRRKALEDSLKHQAFHDALTGLPGRSLFLDRVRHALARTGRERAASVCVLFLDLDGFKEVNDTLGHESGDHLLRAVADRLRGALRAGDTAARLGGDEFVVLLEGIPGATRAVQVAERLAAQVRAPYSLHEREVSVGVSVGVAMNSPGRTDADELVRRADRAMYRAKMQDETQCELFIDDMEAGSDTNRALPL